MKEFLNFIDRFLGNIFKKIEYSSRVNTQSLAYFRIFFGVFMLSHYIPEWHWLGDAPQAFFSPHMFTAAYLSDGFLPKPFYVGIDLLNVTFFCLLTLGVYARFSLVLLFFLNYIGYCYEFGFGKIDHEVHLYLITLLTLAFTNCGTMAAFRKDKPLGINVQRWALSLLSIYIAFGFFTAGLPKFLRWVDFDMSQIGILEWFFKGYFTYDRVYLFADYIFSVPYVLLEGLDYLAPTIELLGFFFLLGGRKSYLLFLSFFHMGNMLILNIEFVLNVTCYGIFLLSPFLSHIRQYLPTGKKAKTLLLSVVGALFLFNMGRKIYYSDYVYYHGFFAERFSTENYLSVIMWLSLITIGIISFAKNLYVIREEP